jgi:hypothetical protein
MRFIYLGVIAWVVLTVFTVVFAASANPRDVRVLRKGIWILLIIGVPVFGALLYLVNGRPIGGKSTKTTLAPDDDPEFLRRLAEQLKEDPDEDQKPGGEPKDG